MRIIIIACLLCFCGYASWGQGIYDVNNPISYLDEIGYRNAHKEVEGTPFLVSDYSIGTLVFQSGASFQSVPMKYDVFSEQLVVKIQDQDRIAQLKNLKEFNFLDSNSGTVRKFLIDTLYDNKLHGLEIVHQNENFLLLRKYSKYIKEHFRNDGYSSGSVSSTKYFEMETTHMIKYHGKYSMLPVSSKKSIIKVLSSITGVQSQTIKKMMTKEGFRTEEDRISLLIKLLK